MLAGRPPFTPDGDEAKLWAHLTEAPPAVSDAAPGLPDAFDDVIARALAKDPEQRFQSAGDLGRAAAAAASGDRAPGRDTVVATGAAAPIEIETRTAGTVLAPPPEVPARRRRSRMPVIGVAVALLAAGAGAWMALADDPETPKAPASRPGLKMQATKVGGRPAVIVGAGGHIWTGRSHRRRLVTLDPSTGKRNPRLRPPAGLGLRGFAVAGRDLWVLASRTGQLVHLDARSGERIGDPVPLPGTASAVAATADAVYVAVTQPEFDPGDQILVIDPKTGETRESITVRRDGVRRLVLARGRLWLLASNPAEIIRIDPSDPSRQPIVRLNADHATDLAVGAGYLWATLADADKLSRIGFDRERTDFPTGRGPSGIAVRKGVVWVANSIDSTLTPIDVRTGDPAAKKLRIRLNPYDVAAYDDAIWVTTLVGGRIYRVTGLDG